MANFMTGFMLGCVAFGVRVRDRCVVVELARLRFRALRCGHGGDADADPRRWRGSGARLTPFALGGSRTDSRWERTWRKRYVCPLRRRPRTGTDDDGHERKYDVPKVKSLYAQLTLKLEEFERELRKR